MERFELENSREFKAAMELENALNDMCFDYKKFAESFKFYHPTLQQSLFRLIREIIYVQADNERRYDARNIASHEIAKKLVKVIATECLPYIQDYVSRMYLFADLDREMETENEKQPTSQLWLVSKTDQETTTFII